jgi:hypothetical protein
VERNEFGKWMLQFVKIILNFQIQEIQYYLNEPQHPSAKLTPLHFIRLQFMCSTSLKLCNHVCNMLNLELSALLKMLFLKVTVRASPTSHTLTYPYFTTRKHCHMQGHTADTVPHWTKYALYRCPEGPLFLVHVTPKINWMCIMLWRNILSPFLKNYKCFYLTQRGPW